MQLIAQCQSKNNPPKIHQPFSEERKKSEKKLWNKKGLVLNSCHSSKRPIPTYYRVNIGLNIQKKKLVILSQFFIGKGLRLWIVTLDWTGRPASCLLPPEFLKVTVLLSCNRAKFFWLCSKPWNFHAQTRNVCILTSFTVFFFISYTYEVVFSHIF